MSDAVPREPVIWRRPRHAAAGAAVWLAVSASVPAQVAPAVPAPGLPPGVTAPAAPGVVTPVSARGPRQLADEIIPILRRRKTPWQLYGSYAQMYRDYADRESAIRPANDRAAATQARLVAHLRGMADLLTRMGDQAKLRQSIQRGTSTVAPEKRQETFVQAGTELDRLLNDFVRWAAALPQTRAASPRRG